MTSGAAYQKFTFFSYFQRVFGSLHQPCDLPLTSRGVPHSRLFLPPHPLFSVQRGCAQLSSAPSSKYVETAYCVFPSKLTTNYSKSLAFYLPQCYNLSSPNAKGIIRMIPRYSRPEMTSIWSEESKFQIWFEIEAHACDAQAKLGVIPAEAATTIW